MKSSATTTDYIYVGAIRSSQKSRRFPGRAEAEAVYDATSTSITLTPSGTVTKTWTHIVSGSNPIIVLTADLYQTATGTGSSRHQELCTVSEVVALCRSVSSYLRKSRRPLVQRPSILWLSTIKPIHGRVTSGAVRLIYFPTSFPASSTFASISPLRAPLSQSKRR